MDSSHPFSRNNGNDCARLPGLPHLHVGYSAGGLGGGRNSDLQNFGARGDFDALAIWKVDNFGLGNQAQQRERASQNRQACLQYEWMRDQVIAEVTPAYSRARYRKKQMHYAGQQVAAAERDVARVKFTIDLITS